MAYCCPECSITLPERTSECPECDWQEEGDDEDDGGGARRAFRGARPSTRDPSRRKFAASATPRDSDEVGDDCIKFVSEVKEVIEETEECADEVHHTSFIKGSPAFNPVENRAVTIKTNAEGEEVALLLDRDYSYTPPKPDKQQ